MRRCWRCAPLNTEEDLENIIKSCENAEKLGEVALVEYDSAISQSQTVFYETLYDENASCHLALGTGFPECIKNGVNMTKEELVNNGINICTNHVDFMIGTDDLEVSGITEDGTEVAIFRNGDWVF